MTYDEIVTALGFDGLCGPNTKPGTPALFNHPENGSPRHLEVALAAGLRLGQLYIVTEVHDMGFVTYLALDGYERRVDGRLTRWFNSCLFSEFPD